MTAVVDYEQFLRQKVNFETSFGFPVHPDEITPILKPHQAAIVQWAIAGGRRAIFAAFGLGKSVIQLEVMRIISRHHRGRQLIVCPLGVRQEFTRDARQLLGVDLTFVRRTSEVGGDGIYITNYESVRDGRLDPALFDAVTLDEASILRSYGSKTYQTFLDLFDGCRFRFVATATPSPNRYKELIHYAGFLGVMDTGQALTRFFQRDSTQANHLTLYPHKETEFWLWLNTWAVFLQRPSDLGYSDDGYDLPDLDVRWHEIPTAPETYASPDRDGQGRLIRNSNLGVVDASREKRDTLNDRLTELMGIIDAYTRSGSPEGVSPGLLPADPRGAAVGSRGQEPGPDSGAAGRSTPVSAGVLRGESGTASRSAAGTGPAELQGEAGELPAPAAPDAAQEVRPDRAAVRGDAARAGRSVPDLPSSDAAAGDRSRSHDGSGPGPAVPDLQLSAGPVRREPGDAGQSNRVSDQVVIWCDLNVEQRAIERALSERGLTYSSIYGSLDVDEVERRLDDWRNRRTYALIGKPVMLGEGLNLQQCNKALFLGVSFKFNQVFQAIHRIQRFGQTRHCEVHFIYAESEREVVQALQAKWEQHKELTEQMSDIIRAHGLDQTSITEALTRSMGVERVEASGNGWLVANNDCVEETRAMDTGSVDLIVTSIPFSNHYEYTPSYNDFGHTDNNDHFWAQMDFLTPELLRVLAPGRLYCCHVKDRILFGNVTGAGNPTVSPFHAEAIMHGRRHGFDYLGMITVVTDVVRENNQSYRLGWSEQCKDGTKMGVGSPEYILLFRKPQTDRSRGYADTPVVKDKAAYSRARWQVDAHAYWRSSGDRHLTPEDLDGLTPAERSRLFEQWTLNHIYDYETHIRIGEHLDAKGVLPATFMSLAPGSNHPDVWHDVNRMLTLNTEQSRRAQAMHVCPLQFDIVDRLIGRYSNPGDLVYDPFGGLFTVPVRALRAGRAGRAVELNPSYFTDGVRYLQAEEARVNTPSLFDLIDLEAAS